MDQERWLVVHAGTHKTATTYIQNRLWSNRDKLLKKSIFLLAPETRKFGRNPICDKYCKSKESEDQEVDGVCSR